MLKVLGKDCLRKLLVIFDDKGEAIFRPANNVLEIGPIAHYFVKLCQK